MQQAHQWKPPHMDVAPSSPDRLGFSALMVFSKLKYR